MNKYTIVALLLTVSLFGQSQVLTKQWTVEGLEAPESAVYFKGHYYVSNVAGQPAEKNGQGYISKVDLDGNMIEQKWITGFNAPKGLGIYKNQLFVADIDQIAVVDLLEGTITKTYQAEGATFLNDVEVGKDGSIYITDTFGGNAIYQIRDGQISILIKDERLDYPNGLKIKGDDLYVASWGVVTNPETFGTDVPGKILRVNLSDKSITEVTKPTGNLDGLINYKNGFLTSDWIAGGILSVDSEGKVNEVLDLNAGSADITYIRKQKVLLVPQMMDGTLVAYELK